MRTVAATGPLDLVEEFRLRRWARTNYVEQPKRQQDWHPIVIEEMLRRDSEVGTVDAADLVATESPNAFSNHEMHYN